MKRKKKSLEFRDNINDILKEIDKFKYGYKSKKEKYITEGSYNTATMYAVIKGFILGFEKGTSVAEIEKGASQ